MRLFDRRPGTCAATFAEAQALVDDGLDPAFVLELFASDADWLAPLLSTSSVITVAALEEEARPMFRAALRGRFLSAAARQQVAPAFAAARAPAAARAGLRPAVAASALAGVAVLAGAAVYGVITAGDAEPGDWNYVFRRAGSQIDQQVSPERGIEAVIREAETRVQRIVELTARPSVEDGATAQEIQAVLEELEAEAIELVKAAGRGPLDDVQKERLKSLHETGLTVLNQVKEKQPALNPAVDVVATRINEAVAVGLGTVTPIETPAATTTPEPSPTETPTPAPTETPSPEPATTATPGPAGDPTASATAVPTSPATPEASPTQLSGAPEATAQARAD
jgi:hypothetical protein